MKKDWKTPLIVIGAVVLVAIIVLIIANFSNKKVELEPLTENDFKILSASWDLYEWDYDSGKLVFDESKPIDWNIQCNYCKTGKITLNGKEYDYSHFSERERCFRGNHHLTVQASQNLLFTGSVDNFGKEELTFAGRSLSGLEPGVQDIQIQISTGEELLSAIDIRKNHELVICALHPSEHKENTNADEFICDSITLQAKCPLN